MCYGVFQNPPIAGTGKPISKRAFRLRLSSKSSFVNGDPVAANAGYAEPHVGIDGDPLYK